MQSGEQRQTINQGIFAFVSVKQNQTSMSLRQGKIESQNPELVATCLRKNLSLWVDLSDLVSGNS